MKKSTETYVLQGLLLGDDPELALKQAINDAIDEVKRKNYLVKTINIVIKDDEKSLQKIQEIVRQEEVLWYHSIFGAIKTLKKALPKTCNMAKFYKTEDRNELYGEFNIIIQQLESAKSHFTKTDC